MRVFVKSYGCSSNMADGETLAGCLAAAGHKLVNSPQLADLIVLNTCAVKGPTENRMISLLKHVPAGKRLIVSGCLPMINFERLCKEVRFDGAVGPAAGETIVGVAERVLRGEKVILLDNASRAMPNLALPRLRSNQVVSIVPVSYGCLGACAYCCVTLARGRLRSYSVSDVVRRVKEDVDKGVREFWITSQDTACYGKDRGSNLAELLQAVCEVNGDFNVRVGMMTPNIAGSMLEELVQAFNHRKVFKFLHLPVQSGDDHVLKRMERRYSVGDFEEIVATFRSSLPEITLSTDIICGFPGEIEEAFEGTLRLIECAKPDVVNVSKFFARPETSAFKMQEAFVPRAEINRRSAMAAALVKKISFERNRRWIGWVGSVLVDEVGKLPGSWVARNFAYKPIALKSGAELLGKTLHVKITKAFSTYLQAEIVD